MVNKILLDYIQKASGRGLPKQKIRSSLLKRGWEKAEVSEAIADVKEALEQERATPLKVPSPSQKEGWSIDLKSLSASQILLYLGGLITILAGVIYIGINWSEWGSAARILAILLPMLATYGVGVPMWSSGQYRKQAMVFITTGSLLFPLFLAVTFRELELFADPYGNEFGLTVSLITLGLYLLLNFIFRHPIWSLLYPVAGLSAYLFLLNSLGIEDSDAVWAFLLPGSLYLLLGYFYESKQERDFSRCPYLLGLLVIFFSLSALASDGSLLKTFLGELEMRSSSGWSHVIVGVVYLLLAWLAERLKGLGFDEAGRYAGVLNLVGAFEILGGGIFQLSTGGKKPVYETLLLVSSLGFIFWSIPRLSRSFLYAGTLFLVVYIFDIGSEYFHNEAGWPITLFVVGLISMGIGLWIEKLRRRFFATKG